MYYVKKPILVKALKLIPENEQYLLDNNWVAAIVYDNDKLDHALIHTLEGTMTSKYGDYICEGVRGEHWSIKNDIFQETYEPYDIDKHQIDTNGNPPEFKKGQKVIVSDYGYIGTVDHQKYKWDNTENQYNWTSVVIKVNGYTQCFDKNQVVPLKN